MPDQEHFRRLERMYLAAPINIYFRPSIQITRGSAAIEIPLREDFFHAARSVHGAVYFKALDDAAYFAASSLVENYFVLTASFNLRLLKPVSCGTFRARGWAQITDERWLTARAELRLEESLVAEGEGKFAVSKLALATTMGYASPANPGAE